MIREKLAVLLVCGLAVAGCDMGGGIIPNITPAPAVYSPGEQITDTVNGIALRFRYVPAGGFQRDGNAANISVITKSYWMGETEVTQELFEAVMGINPSYFIGSPADAETQKNRPAEQVNWYGAIAFCNKLSILAGKQPVYSVSGVDDWAALAGGDIPMGNNAKWNAAARDVTKNGYRLPTETEWMWAAIGADGAGGAIGAAEKPAQPNTTGYLKGYAGSAESEGGTEEIENYVWYTANAGGKTHEVATKTANELNLYDMSGNVWEWVWDWYGTYPAGKRTDYAGASQGTDRVTRGGSWLHSKLTVSPVYRAGHLPPASRSFTAGFRLSRP